MLHITLYHFMQGIKRIEFAQVVRLFKLSRKRTQVEDICVQTMGQFNINFPSY